MRANVRGKGLKGAVGTSASYTQLLEGNSWSARQLEARVMEKLGMQREAHFRQCVKRGEKQWGDEYLYAILEEEWCQGKVASEV